MKRIKTSEIFEAAKINKNKKISFENNKLCLFLFKQDSHKGFKQKMLLSLLDNQTKFSNILLYFC